MMPLPSNTDTSRPPSASEKDMWFCSCQLESISYEKPAPLIYTSSGALSRPGVELECS